MADLEDVNQENILWRFMDLSKFLDLILSKKITLVRPELFEDVYEGSPVPLTKALSKFFKIENTENEKLLKQKAQAMFRLIKYRAYINCWHLNEHESAGMWKLYCTTNDAIAIKTKVAKLKDSLDITSCQVISSLQFGKVEYDADNNNKLNNIANYDGTTIPTQQSISLSECFFIKRKSFEHEKEFRIMAINSNGLNLNDIDKPEEELKEMGPPIIRISCDIESMIEEIIISPTAGSWFYDVVKNVTDKLGYNFKITQSKLYELE